MLLERSHNSEKNISDTIGSVPAHIGVADLKKICFIALHPRFLKWSKDYPLSIDDVSLRHKNWLEISPPRHGQIDCNAIWDKFLTQTKTGQKFSPGTGLELYLEIEHETYERARMHSLPNENRTMVCPNIKYALMPGTTHACSPLHRHRPSSKDSSRIFARVLQAPPRLVMFVVLSDSRYLVFDSDIVTFSDTFCLLEGRRRRPDIHRRGEEAHSDPK